MFCLRFIDLFILKRKIVLKNNVCFTSVYDLEIGKEFHQFLSNVSMQDYLIQSVFESPDCAASCRVRV